jgi:glyoxylase-like metal-dependent hydrolase (beta-lactamase superfamily II)
MFYIKSFTFSPIRENTYVLYNDDRNCIIIDPGCYFDEEKNELSQFINTQKLVPKMLLNTHCHLDHVFGNKFVAEKYQLIPAIHELEKEMLEYAPVSGLMYEMPFENYEGDLYFLKEGDSINIGDDELKVLFTPGHSKGSVSFYCAKQDFLISGDVLFFRSIGRTDLPGGNHETLIKSIREQLFILPDNTVVYSGHGQQTTIGEEKKSNPFLQ